MPNERTILYCVRCDWERDTVSCACANICGNCGIYGLRYVRFDPTTETFASRAVIEGNRDAYDARDTLRKSYEQFAKRRDAGLSHWMRLD
jgi:hypothetical protein